LAGGRELALVGQFDRDDFGTFLFHGNYYCLFVWICVE
jgi:hypothetical protein